MRREPAFLQSQPVSGDAVLVATQNMPTVPEFALLVGSGSIEGTLLGAGQAIAMTRLQLPPRMLRNWPVVTSVAAAIAWSIGLLPSSIPHIPWSSPVQWLVAAIPGLGLIVNHPQRSTYCCGAPFSPPGAGSGSTSSPGRSASAGPSRPRRWSMRVTAPIADRHLCCGRVTDGNHCRGDHWSVLAQPVEERNRPDSQRVRLVAERAASGSPAGRPGETILGFSADRALPGCRLPASRVGH
jgi:hypothetical protein